jgi:hypothetical protein
MYILNFLLKKCLYLHFFLKFFSTNNFFPVCKFVAIIIFSKSFTIQGSYHLLLQQVENHEDDYTSATSFDMAHFLDNY